MNNVITHQQQLLAAIFDCRVQSRFDRKGLSVYRENLRLTSVQALRITFPTVHQLLGDDLFASIAGQLLEQEPPQTGNWASWGNLMPNLLSENKLTHQYPFVADCARLDYVCHQLVRGMDTQTDVKSLGLIAIESPAHLRLTLSPSLNLFVSDYPIAQIRSAHLMKNSDRKAALLEASKLMRDQDRFYIACFRNGFQVQVNSISNTEYQWLNHISNSTLEDALKQSDSKHFSFQDWLIRSVQSNLLHKVVKTKPSDIRRTSCITQPANRNSDHHYPPSPANRPFKK